MKHRYEIIDMLTQDEHGVAYLALDKETGAEVVLRRFFPYGRDGGGLDSDDKAVYDRTIEKLKALSHPSLRKVLDGGTDPYDKLPFLVSESLGGRPLLHRLSEGAFDGAVAKTVLKKAIESCQVLSGALGLEAVWIETDTRGIMVHPDHPEREVTFRISPMRWLGGEPSREGLGSLLRLGEDLTGWGSRIISGTAGEGLGAWVQALRSNSDQWTLQQALDELIEPGSSKKAEAEGAKQSLRTPVIRPPGAPRRKSSVKPGTAPVTTSKPTPKSVAAPRVHPATTPNFPSAPAATSEQSAPSTSEVEAVSTETTPESSETLERPTQPMVTATGRMVVGSQEEWDHSSKATLWPWIAGAAMGLLIVGLGAWKFTRDNAADEPLMAEASGSESLEPASDPATNVAPQSNDVPVTPQDPSTDPSKEPVNARLIQIGKGLHGKVGQEVELEPMKILAYNNTAGVVEFGTIRGPNAVCGVLTQSPDRQQGIRKIMKDLATHGSVVKLKGKVVKLANGRIGIEIVSDKNMVLVSSAPPVAVSPKPAPPKPTSAPKVDPEIDARLMVVGKQMRNKIGQEVELEPFKAVAFENGLLEFGSQKTSNTICGWVEITKTNPRTTMVNRLKAFVRDGTLVKLKGKVVKLPSGRIAIHIHMGHNAIAANTAKPPAPAPKPSNKPTPPAPTLKVDPAINAHVLSVGKNLRKQIGQVVGLEPMQVVAYENGYVEFGTERGPNAICGWTLVTPQKPKNTFAKRMQQFIDKGTWVMLNGKVIETKEGRIAIHIVASHHALDVDPKNLAASIPRQLKLVPKPPPNAQGSQ